MTRKVADMAQDTQNTNELTREEVATILTAPLEQESVFLSVAQHIYDTAGPLRIPALPDSQATALAFVGENEKIPEQDYDFGEVQLLPSTMKSVKVLTKFSNELARQSVVALDSALQARHFPQSCDRPAPEAATGSAADSPFRTIRRPGRSPPLRRAG